MVRLEELRSFIRIVELESYLKAASELGLTQGTVSNHIFALERYFNIKLLTRGARGTKPTKEGKLVYENAKTILMTVERLRQIFESRRRGFKDLITIAASTVPGELILPAYISKFRQKHPDVAFRINIMGSVKSWNLLKTGAVDLAAVGTMQVADVESYARVKIAEERLMLVVPPDHELACKDVVHADEIVSYPYVGREADSGTRIEAECWLEKIGVPVERLNVILEAGSTEAVAFSVSKGVGVSIMSSIAAKRAEAAGLVKTVNLAEDIPKRSFHIVSRRDATLGPAEIFWRFVKAKRLAVKKPDTT